MVNGIKRVKCQAFADVHCTSTYFRCLAENDSNFFLSLSMTHVLNLHCSLSSYIKLQWRLFFSLSFHYFLEFSLFIKSESVSHEPLSSCQHCLLFSAMLYFSSHGWFWLSGGYTCFVCVCVTVKETQCVIRRQQSSTEETCLYIDLLRLIWKELVLSVCSHICTNTCSHNFYMAFLILMT